MHTPEQARELWCPMVRLDSYAEGHGAVNRDSDGHPPRMGYSKEPKSNCIAERCAMWRWGEWSPHIERQVVDDPSFGPGGKSVVNKPIKVPVKGYCGIAGRPEVTA